MAAPIARQSLREKRFVDNTITPAVNGAIAAATVDGTYYNNPSTMSGTLNAVFNGSSAWNRDGAHIIMKSLYLTGYIRPLHVTTSATVGEVGGVAPNGAVAAAPTTYPPGYLRTIVFYFSAANGKAALHSDVVASQLIGASSAGAAETSAIDQNNMFSRGQITILSDERTYAPMVTLTAGAGTSKYYTIEQPGFPTNRPEAFEFKRYIKLKNLPVMFSKGSTGDVTTIITGQLGIVFMWEAAANTSVTACPWGFEGTSRLRFDDPQ